MYWTLRYASQLAEIPLDNPDDLPTQTQLEQVRDDLQGMIEKLKSNTLPVLNEQSAERQRLIEKLGVIVEFLLRLTTHPVHPHKTECQNLLGKVRINAEFTHSSSRF
jgi:hypothetical protein